MADVILVPTDFEQGSVKALELARELAAPLGCEIVLTHVYQLPIYSYPGLEPTLVPSFSADVTAAARRALEELGVASGGLRTVLREGDPATEILALASEREARMIVMGTHGRRGLSHLLLGSVAERVVRRSSVPVLTVRVP